jgi:hypothetical protein
MTPASCSHPANATVFTLGHGTRTAQELTDVLTAAGIEWTSSSCAASLSPTYSNRAPGSRTD